MKIKHFSGYGSVSVTKVESRIGKDLLGRDVKALWVKIKGDHEQGLEPRCEDTFANWIIPHFDKSFEYRKYIKYAIKDAEYTQMEVVFYYFV